MTIPEFKTKAQKAVDHLLSTLKTIRTGRATPAMVEDIMVDAYGSKMPIIQLASIGVPEPRILTISVWDKSVVEAVADAIKKTDLGITPVIDDSLIRLNIPQLTEERRGELSKQAGKFGEACKIALRNIRREFMDELKEMAKSHNLPENHVKQEEENVDKEIKNFNSLVDEHIDNKVKELMTL